MGLMKQYVKSLNKDWARFRYICQKFPVLSNEHLKAEIFHNPKIKQLIKTRNLLKT